MVGFGFGFLEGYLSGYRCLWCSPIYYLLRIWFGLFLNWFLNCKATTRNNYFSATKFGSTLTVSL